MKSIKFVLLTLTIVSLAFLLTACPNNTAVTTLSNQATAVDGTESGRTQINGDIYSCDHYVYPQYRLGNILNQGIRSMVDSAQQAKFGDDKSTTLPEYCRKCEVRFACNGECPKHRFIRTPDGEDGLNYLCAAYKRFFKHIDPYMTTMSQLLAGGQPAAAIMQILRNEAQRERSRTPGRNDPCPCGSGAKFKRCCGNR